jgi:SAM-dependent methyltransferase
MKPSSPSNPYKDYGAVKADYERYKITLDIMPSHLSGTVLDLGVPNPFTPLIRESYPGLEIVNTGEHIDFDKGSLPFPDKSFDAVFSFEVLEHLMNPLWNLLECRRVLKDEGTMFITTPKGGFPSLLMWKETHFHEIDRRRLKVLMQSADLRIRRMEGFNKSPFYWWKMGIFRPTLRVFLGGWFYLEVQKTTQ